MTVSIPYARVALLFVLTVAAAAMMLPRLTNMQQKPAPPTSTKASVARHTPGSAAHERQAYRLRLAASTPSSGS